MTDIPVLYSKPGCVQCKATVRKLDSKGVDYDYVDITESDDAVARIKDLNYLGLPVVYVSPEVHWSGHQPTLIDEHL